MRHMLPALLPVLLLGLASSAAWAAPHKVLDLKVQSDPDGYDREVSICARPSPGTEVPGHMFVAFGAGKGEGTRTYLAVGHTTSVPAKSTILTYTRLLGPVSGYIAEEKYTSTREQCLVLKVNLKDYDLALSIAQPNLAAILPGANPPDAEHPVVLGYSLGQNDCMNLATGVARLFASRGVKVPDRGATELPMTYIRRLIDSN